MILRIDRLQIELPPPSTPDPDGAANVQELLGGKFGETSTFMNYTYQSFNFRAGRRHAPSEMVEHPAARALTGYLLVRGGVHQVAYARALENLTGANLSKLFPAPRIPTEKIPECQPHLKRGEHHKLYRFSPGDYLELAAVWNGSHPETGDPLEVVDQAPEGFPPFDLPPQPAVFAPDAMPDDIEEIVQKMRKAAGLPKEPTGVVANDGAGIVGKVKEIVT